MDNYSLAIAWNWEYDEDYVKLIEKECRLRGISVLEITPSNFGKIFPEIESGRIAFSSLYDRASDDDEIFTAVVDAIEHKNICVLNPHRHIERAKDKATMHLELINAGLQTPYTIIISPYNRVKTPELDQGQIEKLGKPFIIKPANTTGGGTGVVLGAETLKDVLDSRQHHKNDKYLLQEQIHPVLLEGKRAWFRVFYAFGQVIPCWWDDVTHIYHECSTAEEERCGFSEMRRIMPVIQSLCKLDFFSSEIALTADGKFVVIDYVNEICDMRLQSKHPDGVPDAVVGTIARLLAERIQSVVEGSGSLY